MNWVDSKDSPNSVDSLRDNTEPSRGVRPEGVETRRRELTCRVCNRELPPDRFYKKQRPGGRVDSDKTCKSCRIVIDRWKRLGVTQEDYQRMHKEQGGKCGICRERLRSTRYKAFCVDHCHTTGRVRGLLCTRCNTAIGLLKDDPERMGRAAVWVKV